MQNIVLLLICQQIKKEIVDLVCKNLQNLLVEFAVIVVSLVQSDSRESVVHVQCLCFAILQSFAVCACSVANLSAELTVKSGR